VPLLPLAWSCTETAGATGSSKLRLTRLSRVFYDTIGQRHHLWLSFYKYLEKLHVDAKVLWRWGGRASRPHRAPCGAPRSAPHSNLSSYADTNIAHHKLGHIVYCFENTNRIMDLCYKDCAKTSNHGTNTIEWFYTLTLSDIFWSPVMVEFLCKVDNGSMPSWVMWSTRILVRIVFRTLSSTLVEIYRGFNGFSWRAGDKLTLSVWLRMPLSPSRHSRVSKRVWNGHVSISIRIEIGALTLE